MTKRIINLLFFIALSLFVISASGVAALFSRAEAETELVIGPVSYDSYYGLIVATNDGSREPHIDEKFITLFDGDNKIDLSVDKCSSLVASKGIVAIPVETPLSAPYELRIVFGKGFAVSDGGARLAEEEIWVSDKFHDDYMTISFRKAKPAEDEPAESDTDESDVDESGAEEPDSSEESISESSSESEITSESSSEEESESLSESTSERESASESEPTAESESISESESEKESESLPESVPETSSESESETKDENIPESETNNEDDQPEESREKGCGSGIYGGPTAGCLLAVVISSAFIFFRSEEE